MTIPIISTIIVLGVLIFVHELGHFLAARSVGIRVERFSIGLGPKIAGFRRGETEYVLSVIPLGGYVKMGGMDDQMMEAIEGGKTDVGPEGDEHVAEAEEEESEPDFAPAGFPGPRSHRDGADFDSKPVWARAWVISAGVIMNMAFAFLTYTFVAAGWGSANLDTTRIGGVDEEILPASASALADIPPGATLLRVGDRVVEHWGDFERGILDAPDGSLSLVYADPAGEVQIELSGREERELALFATRHWLDPVVDLATPGEPAERAGIRGGDRIVAVDGREVALWWEVQEAVLASPGLEMVLTVEREGERLDLPVTPSPTEIPDPFTGEIVTGGRVGIYPASPGPVFSRVPVLQAARVGWDDTMFVSVQILAFLRDLVTGQVSARNLGSIVAIGEMSGDAAAEGLPVFLQFMALFSINLAILNLLPIPVLDGGHLVFLGIEAVRGQPLSVEQRLRWSQVGFVLLIGIMALALGNDVLRLIGM